MRLRFLAAASTILACGALLSASAQAPAASSSGAASKPKTAKPATSAKAADLTLIDLDGYRKILATYKGKPLVVTFWATWCEPCRDEYPMLVQMAKDYAPKGLAIYGVSLDDDADRNLMGRFLAKNQPTFPNYRQKPGIDVDAFYQGVNPQWTGTMPETIFYTRDGRIAIHFEGAQSREAFAAAIQHILSTSSGQ